MQIKSEKLASQQILIQLVQYIQSIQLNSLHDSLHGLCKHMILIHLYF